MHQIETESSTWWANTALTADPPASRIQNVPADGTKTSAKNVATSAGSPKARAMSAEQTGTSAVVAARTRGSSASAPSSLVITGIAPTCDHSAGRWEPSG